MPGYQWKDEDRVTVEEARELVRAVQRAFRPDQHQADRGMVR